MGMMADREDHPSQDFQANQGA